MPIESDKARARDFIDHLFKNPNIGSEPVLIGEGLILNFISQNIENLKKTFKTQVFFPHLEWSDVLQILITELYDRVCVETLPILDKTIDLLDLPSISSVTGAGSLPSDFQVEKLKDFVHGIFMNRDVRFHMSAVVNIFKYDVIDRYIKEIFERRDSLYNELVRVQRTMLEVDEYIVLMKVLLLVKNAVQVKMPLSFMDAGKRLNLADVQKMPGKLPKYIDDMVMSLREKLPMLDQRVLRLALKANLRENQTETDETGSRFLYILCSRFQQYRPVEKVERGAESPDKSWFAIAMKNAEFHGFDKRMLEGLYRIAGDNRW